ncbi:MAG: gamma-glutamylcyclotransferase [Coleofasciculaceae cyanobacterium RL_1_1]|nr:gamma-glutamylcyclotransferase [Coleofasciculaceae cyanobacterium RL_1_1]
MTGRSHLHLTPSAEHPTPSTIALPHHTPPAPKPNAANCSSCTDRQDSDIHPALEPTFYYFAYGSCMCPVDLQRTLGENTRDYVIGTARLDHYRLAFNRRAQHRDCGVLDIVADRSSHVEGVLYRLPWRLSDRLDEREEIPTRGYQRDTITVRCRDRIYTDVRTYSVVDKLPRELAPNDWYFNVVLRGAVTCGLSEQYCWKLFEHMYSLQQQQSA